MKKILLYASSFVFFSCTTVAHEQRVFERASSAEERSRSAEQNRPGSGVSQNTRTEISADNAAVLENLRTKSPEDYRTEIVAAGLKSLEQGDIAKALEQSYILWRGLDAERSRSPEVNLQNPTFRDPALLLALAQTESTQGSDTNLIELLVRSNPTWEPGYIVLLNAHFKRSSHTLAEKVSRTAIDRIEAPSPTLLSLRAKSLHARNKTAQALKVVEAALRKYPNHPQLVQWQGFLYFAQGRTEDSCFKFANAYKAGGADAVLTHNHAVCLTQSGQWDEAISVIKSALPNNPQDAPLRLIAGTVLKKLGHYEEARQVWHDYLELKTASKAQRETVLAALNGLDIQGRVELSTSKPLPPR
jgi:tetratricopeptide (TPR) repeat protein